MDLHRLGEERSIALHARVAELLREDPNVLAGARARVEQWAVDGSVAQRYVEQWREVLALPIDQLCAALVDESERGRALRQVSPFAGVIDPRERWRIRRAVADRERA